MGVARIRVSAELIVDALGLPPDVEIIDASFQFSPNVIILTIMHDDLPTVPADEPIPLAEPQYESLNPRRLRPGYAFVFCGWGVP